MFLTTATLDMIDELIEKIVLYKSSVEEQKIIQLKERLQRLRFLIEKSALVDFIELVSDLEEDFKRKLLEKVDLNIEELNNAT